MGFVGLLVISATESCSTPRSLRPKYQERSPCKLLHCYVELSASGLFWNRQNQGQILSMHNWQDVNSMLLSLKIFFVLTSGANS